MNNLKNKVQLIGHLGAAPEVRNLDKGNKVARIRLATSDRYKNNKGEWVENTDWHTVVAWGKTAELAEKLLQKGSEVLIEGKLSNRQYTDKSGATKYVTEVVMHDFQLLGKAPKTNGNATAAEIAEDEKELAF